MEELNRAKYLNTGEYYLQNKGVEYPDFKTWFGVFTVECLKISKEELERMM